MALPVNDLVQVQIVGHLTGGEIFTTGFWLSDTPIATQADANSLAAAIKALITTTSFATIRSAISATSGYDVVRVYSHPDGQELAQFIGESGSTSVVGTGTTYHPLQCALVVTTRTNLAGRRHRGRMYFPWTAAPLGSDHQVGSGSLAPFLAEVDTFLTAVNALTGVGGVAVVSRVGAGEQNPVTAISADTRLDIQRRRANRQVATAEVSLDI